MLDFEQHLKTLSHEPQWSQDYRANAWEEFSKLPLPAASDESWRLLDLKTINDDTFQSPEGRKKLAIAKNIDELFVHSAAHEHWGKQIKQYIANPAVVISESSDGYQSYSSQQTINQGVVCTALSEALTKHGDLIKSFIAKTSDNGQLDKFALFNQAMCGDGVFIYIPDNIVLTNPVVCLNLFQSQIPSMAMSRFVLLLGKNAQLSMVNILAGDKQNPNADKNYALVDYLFQAHLQAGARLDHVEIQSFNDSTFVINNTNYYLDKDSRLDSLTAAFGAGQFKGEIRAILKERGAESRLNGIILGNKNECFNFNTIDDHDAPDTKSSIDFRVALKDEAKSMYHGTIKVSEEAIRTDAFQSNKNLLLSEKTQADSIPKLEILTDDVKCSHGATVGPVDRNQVFYLMSRGLSKSSAEELIVNGFFHQLVGDCKIEGVSDWLDSIVAHKI